MKLELSLPIAYEIAGAALIFRATQNHGSKTTWLQRKWNQIFGEASTKTSQKLRCFAETTLTLTGAAMFGVLASRARKSESLNRPLPYTIPKSSQTLPPLTLWQKARLLYTEALNTAAAYHIPGAAWIRDTVSLEGATLLVSYLALNWLGAENQPASQSSFLALGDSSPSKAPLGSSMLLLEDGPPPFGDGPLSVVVSPRRGRGPLALLPPGTPIRGPQQLTASHSGAPRLAGRARAITAQTPGEGNPWGVYNIWVYLESYLGNPRELSPVPAHVAGLSSFGPMEVVKNILSPSKPSWSELTQFAGKYLHFIGGELCIVPPYDRQNPVPVREYLLHLGAGPEDSRKILRLLNDATIEDIVFGAMKSVHEVEDAAMEEHGGAAEALTPLKQNSPKKPYIIPRVYINPRTGERTVHTGMTPTPVRRHRAPPVQEPFPALEVDPHEEVNPETIMKLVEHVVRVSGEDVYLLNDRGSIEHHTFSGLGLYPSDDGGYDLYRQMFVNRAKSVQSGQILPLSERQKKYVTRVAGGTLTLSSSGGVGSPQTTVV